MTGHVALASAGTALFAALALGEEIAFSSPRIRSRTRRRSTSSFCSPGPRPPMPPISRDSPAVAAGHQSRKQVLELCELDLDLALVGGWARREKMSRISCARSMTLRSVASAIARAWRRGVRFLSTTMKSAEQAQGADDQVFAACRSPSGSWGRRPPSSAGSDRSPPARSMPPARRARSIDASAAVSAVRW